MILMTGQGHQSQCKCVKLKKGQHLTQYQKSRLNSSQAKIINQSFGGGKNCAFSPSSVISSCLAHHHVYDHAHVYNTHIKFDLNCVRTCQENKTVLPSQCLATIELTQIHQHQKESDKLNKSYRNGKSKRFYFKSIQENTR